MSNRVSGLQGYVLVSSPTVTGSADEWLGAKSFTVAINADAPDVTGFDSGGWKETVPGLKSFTGSVEASWDSDMDLLVLGTGGTPPLVGIGKTIRMQQVLHQYTVNSVEKVTALIFNAVITNLTWNVAVNGAVEYSIQFAGDGSIDLNNLEHTSIRP